MPSEKSMQAARALINRHDETTCCSKLAEDIATTIDEAVAAERERVTSWLRVNMRIRADEFGRLNDSKPEHNERWIRNSAAYNVLHNTANEFHLWVENVEGYDASKEAEVYRVSRGEKAEEQR